MEPNCITDNRCFDCDGEGWVYFKGEDGSDWVKRCNHGQDSQENYGFPGHVEEPLENEEVAKWVEVFAPGDVIHLTGHPNRALEAGLSVAEKLAEKGIPPRYYSARDMDSKPNGFERWPVVAIGDVDGGLSSACVRVLADALQDTRGTIIVMGTPTSRWPRYDSFAALNLALRKKEAKEIQVKRSPVIQRDPFKSKSTKL